MPSNTKSDRFTEAFIRDAKPEAATRIFWDHAVKGLGVRITPAGSKSFVLQYRVAGRSRRSTVAQCSAISLKRAREIAGEQLAAIRNQGADPLQRRQDAMAAPSVADGLDRFFAEYGPARVAIGRMRESTLEKYHAQAEKYVRPALGAFKVADVRRRDVVQMLARVGGPVQRNRVQAFTSRLFSAFEEFEIRAVDSNPARRITKTLEKPRNRVFAASEIAAIGAAIDGLACPVHKAALRFLLLTSWRNGEALSLEWDKIDFEGGVADLPNTKTGAARKQVASLALELLATLPRTNARVFHPVTYGTLRHRLLAVCREAKVPDARLHDIRRTVASNAGAAGASAFAIRDMLGHSSLAMSNRYVRLSAPAVQSVQHAAASRMAAQLAGTSAVVVDHPKRRAS